MAKVYVKRRDPDSVVHCLPITLRGLQTTTNKVDPNEALQNSASDQCVQCLLLSRTKNGIF